MKIKQLLVLATFLSVIFSCKKDMTDGTNPPVDPGFGIPSASPVSGKVSGVVLDENNNPVQNAEVVLSGSSYMTDAKGHFNINNKVLDKYVTTVTVNKTGYFKALRSFSATANRNNLTIKLIPKTLAGTVDAAGGGAVNLSNGTAINFQTNSIVVKGTGAAYTGSVKVFASYIDPTTSDFAARVPGSMMAQDAENMFVLQSAGMIAVDLESPGGQALQLASGKTAAIKLPIPSSILSKAPATIDTWSLNDKGVWVKEGTATKNGNFYEMEVTHFSFWNCDVPANAVYVTIHVHDQNGNPLSGAMIELSIPGNNTWWGTTDGFTDNTGTVAGLVPSNQQLTLSVYPDMFSCATPLATQAVGPFSSDTTLNIVVTLSGTEYTTVTGTVVDCNGDPLANGFAWVYIGNYFASYVDITNGTYTTTVSHCDPITTINIDVADSLGGYTSSGPVTVSGNSVTVPVLTVCSANQGAEYTFLSANPEGTYTVGTALNSSNRIAVQVNVTTTGPYFFSTDPTTNGMLFTASGVFNNVGVITVYLDGSGVPQTAGVSNLTIICNDQTQTFGVGILVNPGAGPSTAVFTLGSGGTCPNVFVAGDYTVGFPLTVSNNITLMATVTTPGTYYVSTNTTNGMAFQDSGVFTATGVVTIVLHGYGTPAVAGINTYQVSIDGSTTGGCVFTINSVNTTSSGVFSTCLNYTIGGNYQAGVAVSNNGIGIIVDVLSVGAYTVTTGSVNGISFTGSGIFSSTGQQSIYLTASGTPTTAGTFMYPIALNGGAAGLCSFPITVN